ncbi:MAG: peptidase M54 [Myxococcota bacterium]
MRRPFPGTEPAPEHRELPAHPMPAEALEASERDPAAPIVLLPVGRIDTSHFECVRRPLAEVFGRSVVVGLRLPVPKYAFNPTRGQYHSAAIMKRVEGARQEDWDAAIGVSREDLFVPEVPFVFGEADRSTRTALLSLARLKPDSGSLEAREELLERRLISEAIHQVGLLRGLAHCPNNRCVMFYAASVAEIDKRGASLCANCKKRLVAVSG